MPVPVIRATLLYTFPRSSQSDEQQEANAAKPDLTENPDASLLARLDVTLHSDEVTNDDDNFFRTIVLTLGEDFQTRHPTDALKAAAVTNLFTIRFELIQHTTCVAAEPVITHL